MIDLEMFEDHLRSLHRGGWPADSIVGRAADEEFDEWIAEHDRRVARFAMPSAG